jgi:hypothetical protein
MSPGTRTRRSKTPCCGIRRQKLGFSAADRVMKEPCGDARIELNSPTNQSCAAFNLSVVQFNLNRTYSWSVDKQTVYL